MKYPWIGLCVLAVKQNPFHVSLNPLETFLDASTSPDPVTCDVTFENTLCLKNGRHVSDNLVARYKFDSGRPIDSSGHGFHGQGSVYPGPSPFGSTGYSAVLRNVPLTIPNLVVSGTREWAFSFWLFLLSDIPSATPNDAFCPGKWLRSLNASVLSRGTSTTTQNSTPDANPVIWVNAKTGAIRVGVTTSRDPTALEFMESNARLNRQQWYRISVTRQENRIVLYVNGVKDSFLDTTGEIPETDPVLLLGAGGSGCDLPLLLDDLHVWNASPGALYIEALSSAAMLVEPARFELSCVQCTKTQAEEGCSASYHLCSDQELQGGGILHAAHSLGWTKLGYRLFTSGPQKGLLMQTHTPTTPDSPSDITDEKLPGLGVCCRD